MWDGKKICIRLSKVASESSDEWVAAIVVSGPDQILFCINGSPDICRVAAIVSACKTAVGFRMSSINAEQKCAVDSSPSLGPGTSNVSSLHLFDEKPFGPSASILISRPQTHAAFKDKEWVEKMVLKEVRRKITTGLNHQAVVSRLPPDIRHWFFDNPSAQVTLLQLLKSTALRNRTYEVPVARMLQVVGEREGLWAETRDRSGCLRFLATVRAIEEYVQLPVARKSSSLVHKLVLGAGDKSGKGGMVKMTRALNAVAKHMSMCPIICQTLTTNLQTWDNAKSVLATVPQTEEQFDLRVATEAWFINKADSLKSKRPRGKQVLKAIRRNIRAQFGDKVLVERKGSTRKRTDIQSSDLDLGFGRGADILPVTRDDMETLQIRFQADHVLKDLDTTLDMGRAALKLTIAADTASRDERYEIVPLNPAYFEYDKVDYARTRGTENREAADTGQYEYFRDNIASQRATRVLKQLIKDAGDAAEEIDGFIAEHLVQMIPEQKGFEPKHRGRTGFLTASAVVSVMRATVEMLGSGLNQPTSPSRVLKGDR
ncbi:unnamed protein product [Polarella glacialis]|uniref:Uncharacterized protein n=1 Tax=Polarella glacialis TaxID=89957 RepID=A0A813FNI2_POLGL|nr:unnamed protein product [Polarella glacialis]